MLTLQERAQLQLSLKSLKEKYQKLFDDYQNSEEYLKSNFIEKMMLMDEFRESPNIFPLLSEIKSIENQLSGFMDEVNSQDDEGCINCSG